MSEPSCASHASALPGGGHHLKHEEIVFGREPGCKGIYGLVKEGRNNNIIIRGKLRTSSTETSRLDVRLVSSVSIFLQNLMGSEVIECASSNSTTRSSRASERRTKNLGNPTRCTSKARGAA